MMEATDLGTFITDVNQLIDEFEKLKQHTLVLHNENQALIKSNDVLGQKNKFAQDAVQSIISRLREVKP